MLLSSNFPVQVIGKLFIDGDEYKEIDVIDNVAHAGLHASDNAIVCCAVLDPVAKVVYVNNGKATTHSDILHVNDLVMYPTNQNSVDGGLICGFILSGGYFANRRQASRHVLTSHNTLTRKRLWTEDLCFNSEMIDWYAVRSNIDSRYFKTAKQQRVAEVWGVGTPESVV